MSEKEPVSLFPHLSLAPPTCAERQAFPFAAKAQARSFENSALRNAGHSLLTQRAFVGTEEGRRAQSWAGPTARTGVPAENPYRGN